MNEKEKRMEAYIKLLHYMLKHGIREHDFAIDHRPRLNFKGMIYLPMKLFINSDGRVEIKCHYITANYDLCPNMYPPACDMSAEDIYIILDAMKKDIIRLFAE